MSLLPRADRGRCWVALGSCWILKKRGAESGAIDCIDVLIRPV